MKVQPFRGLCRITNLEWLVVAVAAPLILFPTVRPRWTVVTLGVLAALWFLRWLVRREPWPVTPFNGALLLLVVMIPVATWASAIPELTLPKAAGLVLGLAVFRAVALAACGRPAFSLVAFCVLGIGIIAVGVFGAQWLEKAPVLTALTRRIPRLITALPDLQAAGISANQIAGALTLYLPLAVALVIGRWAGYGASPQHLLVLAGSGAFALLVSGVLLLTQSRAGWTGGVVGLLALGTLWGLSHRQRRMRTLGIVLPLLAFMAVAGVFFYAGPQRVGEILYEAGSGAAVEQAVGEMSLAGRVEVWNRALYAVQDFPFTGCGLGTFRRVVHILYPLFLASPDLDIAHAHNIFLQTALDLGLPGLIAYLALLGIAMTICWRCARRGGPLVRATALGLAAGLVGLHVYGLADAVALGSKPGVAFWFTLGLIAALPNVARQEAREGAPKPCLTHHGSRQATEGCLHYACTHPWFLAAATLLALALLVAGVYLAWGALPKAPSARSSIRLPLYPEAQGMEVRTETPSTDTDWVGALEIATFTTTHPITDVAGFYTDALVEAGWETEIEAGDETSWGGIYTREGGLSVCLLNAFDIEGQTWISIVCGDKAEPMDIPPVPAEN
jgi:putative inorganic carbon (HCO3(-)) transporter